MFCTEGRFVSGVGASHPLETGFVWHRTLGVPYLPGSSIKGMMRAWADPGKGWGGCRDPQRVVELFGDWRHEEEGDDNPADNTPPSQGAGRLIVFDALPESAPKLEVDVLNVHYQKYYQGKTPPGDYLDPVPVYFLVVAAGQPFDFALACRENGPDSARNLEDGVRLLREALHLLGAGAKTSSGYGTFYTEQLPEPARAATQESVTSPDGANGATAREEPEPAEPREDRRVADLRGKIEGFQESNRNAAPNWVGLIEQIPNDAIRAELAGLLLAKLVPNEKARQKAEGKGWYRKLVAMQEEQDPG